MNLQSPTTLLSSIQSMRSRLRSDKELLNDIKHDYSHMAKKPRPSPIETILEESISMTNSYHNVSLSKGEQPTERTHRTRIVEIRKQHQKEIKEMRAGHQRELREMEEGHAREKEEKEAGWR